MTYKESLAAAMDGLAADPLVCFTGYGLLTGRAAGTLRNVPAAQIIETPVAENLMVGLATGLALAGRRPVVFIERFDFILNALDAIVNHLNAMGKISDGQFRPAVILRVVAGNHTKPLHTGPTHVQNFTTAVRAMVDFPVVELGECIGGTLFAPPLVEIGEKYRRAAERQRAGQSTLLVEHKDLL